MLRGARHVIIHTFQLPTGFLPNPSQSPVLVLFSSNRTAFNILAVARHGIEEYMSRTLCGTKACRSHRKGQISRIDRFPTQEYPQTTSFKRGHRLPALKASASVGISLEKSVAESWNRTCLGLFAPSILASSARQDALSGIGTCML